MATIPRLLTYEEWLKLPSVEDGTDEVVKGELQVMPPTRYPHAEIIQLLIACLAGQIDPTRVGLLGSNLGLMIRPEPLTCRSPDLILFWREQMKVKDGLYWSAPGLIIEVLSPSETRYRQDGKLADYASIGVPEVWLVSPEAATIEILLLNNGQFERQAILADGSIQPSQFPQVSVPVRNVFAI